MAKTVIKIENLSKIYRLGEVGTGTITHDLNRWWAKVRGKEDPFSKIGQVNDRTQKAGKGEHVYALKDINFEVKQGEVLGIIGKNGAGKSTLLKIMSRITSPSTGSIKVKGRVASLLEVGTGFHPEMTGKENVYLNGTILGMTKREIDQKFEEIMDFAGCLKYADTPVKRYSSGMMVRLGFAVAAFLEPEILIVDEVLAVGDAEFQKKAIGKMQDISSGQGRTVLFVSHNMGAVRNLCARGVLLENGEVYAEGEINKIIDRYLSGNVNEATGFLRYELENAPGDDEVKLLEFSLQDTNGKIRTDFGSHEEVYVHVLYRALKDQPKFRITLAFYTMDGNVAFITMDNDQPKYRDKPLKCGTYLSKLRIPAEFLNTTTYMVRLSGGIFNVKSIFQKVESLKFNIIQAGGVTSAFNEKRSGVIAPLLDWEISNQ